MDMFFFLASPFFFLFSLYNMILLPTANTGKKERERERQRYRESGKR